MKKIYLATPYSHEDENVRLERFKRVNVVAAKIMRDNGYLVFSPISHSHPIAVQCDLPLDFDFWEEFDKSFIEWCDEVWILMLDDWDESKGVKSEMKIAKELNKKIRYLNWK